MYFNCYFPFHVVKQVFPGSQFGLEWVDFKPERKTVMIVHGFMSHSNASWVLDMTSAFLEWVRICLCTNENIKRDAEVV